MACLLFACTEEGVTRVCVSFSVKCVCVAFAFVSSGEAGVAFDRQS